MSLVGHIPICVADILLFVANVAIFCCLYLVFPYVCWRKVPGLVKWVSPCFYWGNKSWGSPGYLAQVSTHSNSTLSFTI